MPRHSILYNEVLINYSRLHITANVAINSYRRRETPATLLKLLLANEIFSISRLSQLHKNIKSVRKAFESLDVVRLLYRELLYYLINSPCTIESTLSVKLHKLLITSYLISIRVTEFKRTYCSSNDNSANNNDNDNARKESPTRHEISV